MASDQQPQERRGAPLTDRVNAEPAIINGMSATEASYIGGASLAISVVLGGGLFFLTGYWHFIFVLGIALPMVTIWYSSFYLQSIKRSKPERWYVQAFRIYLARKGIVKSRYITHDGYMELGRKINSDPFSQKSKEKV
ncbi:TIGR03750 family conjugal transfer protein [Delftia tsuruhatensis]|jgi:conjugative transfer region protein (TIGR03750 family)|uniref:TIGR03750 family conjugal transfer protein n=1 Tax=Delftia tsuruhatensis TaxID=180282 RepID=UPI0028964E6C|nr:TIGR03750 family conjugal transfer protein [Delftia tsuruhatensis]WQM86024.1 TIGR03750 family conjugal transfer protein [Delftia tsuruhatensis]